MSRREEILCAVKSVPALPSAAVQVVRLMSDPDVKTAELATMIEYEPGLAANVLRLANSAYFGKSHSIGSIRDAIVFLGLKRIFQLVMASAIAPLTRNGVKGYDLQPGSLWQHSVAAAIGSEELAQALGRPVPDIAFTAGLLHDLGKIVLGTFVAVDAAPIMALMEEQEIPFNVAEQRILGVDHAEVGAALLETWSLPERLVGIVRWHHDPESYGGDELAMDLVHMADSLSLEAGIGVGTDGLYYRVSKTVTERLGLTIRLKEHVASNVLGELGELTEMFTRNPGR